MTLPRSDAGYEARNFDKTNISEIAGDVCAQARTLAEAKQLQWSASIRESGRVFIGVVDQDQQQASRYVCITT